MKLFHKGVLLVAIPGLFELGLLGILYKSQENTTQAQAWALHTKNVIIQAAEVREPALLQSARLRAGIIFNDATGLDRNDLWDSIDKEIAELHDLVRDNPVQLANLEKIRATLKDYRNWTDELVILLKNGQRDELMQRIRDPIFGRRMPLIKKLLADFIANEEALDVVRLQQMERAYQFQRIALMLALLGSVLVAAIAVRIFSRDVAGRLAVLTTNAHRLSELDALEQEVSGNDEIAELDKVLHQASARLRTAEDAKRRYRDELESHARELTVLNKNLQRQTQDNEMFIYSVSHDLRSPLVNLQGFSKELHHAIRELHDIIAASHLHDQEKQQIHSLLKEDIDISLKFIRTAVTRSASIIDAMLRLSRIGRVEYQLQEINVNEIVQRVIDAMSSTIRQRRAVLLTKPLPACYGDATAIEQIFGNLIGNAINYLDPNRSGTVLIDVLPFDPDQPDFRTYYVKDNGLGIPTDYLSKMFSAFNRLHADCAPGEGVGLALIKRIVLRHGGKIWVESIQDVGTTFYTSLPVRPIDHDINPIPQG